MTPLEIVQNELKNSNVDVMLIPHNDPYQGEYLVACDEVLKWISGFSGSAGFCIVTHDKATLFVDGRYTLQAVQQVNTDTFTIETLGTEITWLTQWITQTAPLSCQIAYDPWRMSVQQRARFANSLPQRACMVAREHMMHALWTQRPDHPKAPLFHHPLRYTGESNTSKCTKIAKALRSAQVDAYVLNPESWSWLLNIRGGDLHYTPISQGFAWITPLANTDTLSIDLFLHTCDQTRLLSEIENLIAQDDPDGDILKNVTFHEIQDFSAFLSQHSALCLGYDPNTTPAAIVDHFKDNRVLTDPCALPRAIKNATEIEGARQAHRRDARAFHAFRTQFENNMKHGQTMYECDVVNMLLKARQDQPDFHSPSFDTIAGFADNGAIVHYKPDVSTHREITSGSFLLIDSGGQYAMGTTDVTRTLAIGTPTEDMKFYYTLVLKAHIALTTLIFPKGTPGPHIDMMARKDLWAHGLDFAHGTGHGVGSFLSVHEGPQRISPVNARTQGLVEGMIVSIEPGLYVEGHFGIRLENLVVVQPASPQTHPLSDVIPAHKTYLGFEPLTYIPFEEDLILWGHLSESEQAWLKTYQAQTQKIINQ